jgi:glutamine amidotransferase
VVDSNPLLKDLDNCEFYFMHSFEMVNYINISALTEYKNHSFVSAIQNKNLYGVQFHPEKSRESGIKLLSNFIKLKSN